MRNIHSIIFGLFFCLIICSQAISEEPAAEIDLNTCKDNQAIDAYLRKTSSMYAAMARLVEFRGGYQFEDRDDIEGGYWYPSNRTIGIKSQLQGPGRITIVAFEMTNAYQQRLHCQVDQAAMVGTITSETEFSLRHELVEYDGMRIHREILKELEQSQGKLSGEYFFVSLKKPESVNEYQLPLVMDFVAQMESSGHSDLYRKWFRNQTLNKKR